MKLVQIVLLAAVLCTASAVRWSQFVKFGDGTEHSQGLWLQIDVNAEGTVLLNSEQYNNFPVRGYNTSISPLYKPSAKKYYSTHAPPIYNEYGALFGIYASDGVRTSTNTIKRVTFGLANNYEGRNPASDAVDSDFYGLLALNRKGGERDEFQKLVLQDGNAFCAAANCQFDDELSLRCHGTSFSAPESGPKAFDGFKDTTFYTEVRASGLNKLGWTFQAQGYKFGALTSKRPLKLTLSSTSNFLTVPDALFQTILKKFNATKGDGYKVDIVPIKYLKTGDPIVLNINNKEITIEAKEYLKNFISGWAQLFIRGGAADNEWIVGRPFTNAVAVCLDYQKHTASLHKVRNLFP